MAILFCLGGLPQSSFLVSGGGRSEEEVRSWGRGGVGWVGRSRFEQPGRLLVLDIGINLRFLPQFFIFSSKGLEAVLFKFMVSLRSLTCFSIAVSGDDDVSVAPPAFKRLLPPNSGLSSIYCGTCGFNGGSSSVPYSKAMRLSRYLTHKRRGDPS